MNTDTPHFNYTRPADAAPDFDRGQLAESQPMVEHLSITEFMQRIPHRWHLDDINRFGDKVGWTANSIQLARMMIQSPSLGLIRVFPVPLLIRIYTLLSPSFGWPALPPVLEDRRTPAEERVARHLHTMLEAAQDATVRHSIGVILQAIGRQQSANSQG